MKKKSINRAPRAEKAPRFAPHPDDANEARLSAESAKRDEFLSAADSAAIVTDWLDGWLARRTNSVSPFGKIADPIADKILVPVSYTHLCV